MVKIAFAGAFAARFAEPVQAQLQGAHEIAVSDEAGIVSRLAMRTFWSLLPSRKRWERPRVD